MPPQRRRRTANQVPDDEPPRRRQSHRAYNSDDGSAAEEEEEDQDQDGDVHMDSVDQLVSKLVRYALACEYARMPIKRDGIRDKVLGSNARSFKRVFDGAQVQLREVFGIEMSELPVREKRTLRDKQKAAARRAASQASASSRQYVLISTLPPAYKAQPIVGPSRIPSQPEEAAYVGFYTLLIALVVLSGGELSDTKLRRYLDRLNADQNLPSDKTENVLAKLVRQGYVDKVVEKSDAGDDDTVTWCVGPRGRVEVPPASIKAVVTQVWGEPEDQDDFDKKLNKSLGLQNVNQLQGEAE
ncbi:MAGE family protein [Xylariaceae sp. FL0804]|nr:MAGE family protein [Xylariaceae sp. FL0804]